MKWDWFFIYLDMKQIQQRDLLLNDRFFVFHSHVLGTGSFATVKLAIDVHSLERLACKIINVQYLKSRNYGNSLIQGIQKEIQVLQQIQHPNIVSIRHAHHDTRYWF